MPKRVPAPRQASSENVALRVLVLHGPNLNLLGTREPAIYGSSTLEDIERDLRQVASELGATLEARQSNHEGQLIDWIQQAMRAFDGIVLNAGALTHTSYALADAITATGIPCVEVHISNIYRRERFRHRSRTAPACIGSIAGFGPSSYTLGLRALIGYLRAARGNIPG